MKGKRIALYLVVAILVIAGCTAIVFGAALYRDSLSAAVDGKLSFDGGLLYKQAFERIRDTHIALADREARLAWSREWQTYKDTTALLTEEGTDEAIVEMLRSLEQRFDSYRTPQAVADGKSMADPSFVGIGISVEIVGAAEAAKAVLSQLPDEPTETQIKDALESAQKTYREFVIGPDNPLIVSADPVEGGPASKAGIKRGDRIVAVDGTTLDGLEVEDVIPLIRGKEGTEVVLTIDRTVEGGETSRLALSMPREKIELHVAFHRELENGVHYVRLYHFMSKDGIADMRAALSKASSARALILDLRFNPGGDLAQVITIASMLLEDGTVVELKARDGDEIVATRHVLTPNSLVTLVTKSSRPDKSEITSAPREPLIIDESKVVVVLINQSSYSASELLAGALQNEREAIVVGMPSGGKGVGQRIIDLPYARQLSVTNFEFLPAAKPIDWIGVMPDIEVELAKWNPKEPFVDTQLESAKQEALDELARREALEQERNNLNKENHERFENALQALEESKQQ